MIPDLDIFRSAQVLVKRHGQDVNQPIITLSYFGARRWSALMSAVVLFA